MAFLNNVLSKLISRNDYFCGLCFQNIESGARVHIQDVFVIDVTQQTTAEFEMSEILSLFLSKEVLNTVFTIGSICNHCKASAISSYKFIKMCEENSKFFIKSIESIVDSLDNTLNDLTGYNNLFFSLNMKDFTTLQFYDMKRPVHNIPAAFKRFRSLLDTQPRAQINKGGKVKIKCNDSETEMINKVVKARKKRVPIQYDIVSVPNSQIIMNGLGRQYKCKVCAKGFREITKVRSHFFRLHYPRKIKCPKCPQRFISKKVLEHHDNINHCQLVCNECGKQFTNKYVLQKHEINHNMKLICQECGRVYRSREAFNKHITDNICKQKMRKTSEQGIYFCDYCNKRYCNKPYLAKHIKFEHENAEGFKCKYCNKTFYTPSLLQVHTYKHTHEKKFECQECGGRFVTRTSLLYHTRLHTGDRPYQCEHCDQAFLSASRRLDHTRRHHMAPSLECDICHSKFKASNSLLKHKKRHLDPSSRLNREHSELLNDF